VTDAVFPSKDRFFTIVSVVYASAVVPAMPVGRAEACLGLNAITTGVADEEDDDEDDVAAGAPAAAAVDDEEDDDAMACRGLNAVNVVGLLLAACDQPPFAMIGAAADPAFCSSGKSLYKPLMFEPRHWKSRKIVESKQ
jgi:hypothetical protein